MAAPAAAPGESLQEGAVANRIKDLERNLGEAQTKFNKVEAEEKGKAQTPPTLQGEDAGSGTLSKSGADRVMDADPEVAMRIKDLERKLGEAQKKLNKMEANENGKAQNPPCCRRARTHAREHLQSLERTGSRIQSFGSRLTCGSGKRF